MWVVCETGSKSLREIGELFGGLDYAAVAQRIRRTKSTYNPIAARRLITAMLNVLGRVAQIAFSRKKIVPKYVAM